MRLYLLRHARAVSGATYSDDHERPLDPEGVRDAARIGDDMVARGRRPSRALCSSALRAVQTLDAILAALPVSPNLAIRRDLYLANANQLLEAIRNEPPETSEVLIVGHNPGLGMLALRLLAGGDEQTRQRLRSGYPAGAMAAFGFSGGPDSVAPATGELEAFITPSDLA